MTVVLNRQSHTHTHTHKHTHTHTHTAHVCRWVVIAGDGKRLQPIQAHLKALLVLGPSATSQTFKRPSLPRSLPPSFPPTQPPAPAPTYVLARPPARPPALPLSKQHCVSTSYYVAHNSHLL